MRSDPSTNLHLNLVLKTALVAINQYFLHARMLGSWGLEGLELQEYQAAIRSMKHANKVMSRILTLEGAPVGLSLRDLAKLLVGENVSDLLKNDLTMESLYQEALTAAIAHCKEKRDFVSLQNLEPLHTESEYRIGWLRGELGLIDKMGTQSYLESSTFATDASTRPAEQAEQSAAEPSSHSMEPSTQPSLSTTRRIDRDGSHEAEQAGTPSTPSATHVSRDMSGELSNPSSRTASASRHLRYSEPSNPSEAGAGDASKQEQPRQEEDLPDFAADRSDRANRSKPQIEQDSSSILLNSFFVG